MQEEYIPDLIGLTDEDGNEYNFEVLDAIESDGNHYVALIPCLQDGSPDPKDDGSVIIMKAFEPEEGDGYFEEIEDDDEYNTIADAFKSRLEDFFEIEDE